MNITPVVEILILTVLLFVAAELYVIARELSRGISILLKDREGRDSREVQGAGQTINVNLAPTQTGVPSAVHSATIPPSAAAGTQPDSLSPETVTQREIPSQNGRDSGTPAPKSVPSGQFAVTCSRCQAENSSYRHECFNCGGPL